MFKDLKNKVANQFATMDHTKLLVVDLEKRSLFDAYLSTFEDPVERQSHNCNCCRRFLDQFGAIVEVKDGVVRTMWDFQIEGEFSKVPAVLRQIVLNSPITHAFITKTNCLGTDSNLSDSGHRWEHFYVASTKIPTTNNVGEQKSALEGLKQVFSRGLQVLKYSACEQVLDLIQNNAINRGAQYLPSLETFMAMKKDYDKLTSDKERELFVWENFRDGGRLRNSAIGTLIEDLSEGRSLESAISSYETKVSAANYMHTTADTSASQLYLLKKKLEELGVYHSIERRHATPSDIPLDKTLFVNRDREIMDPFASIQKELPVNTKTLENIPECKLAQFVESVLPKANKVEILVDGTQNQMSLIAPVHTDSGKLLSWSNEISWTYANNLTDVVSERVKKAGGNVEDAEVRISLSWYNTDDLDLSVVEPSGNVIDFRNRRSRSGGFLDVDMNIGGESRTPVENIAWQRGLDIPKGKYSVKVKNFYKRETKDVGFRIDVWHNKECTSFTHTKVVRDSQIVDVLSFEYTKDGLKIINVGSTMNQVQATSNSIGGVKSGTFQQVDMALYSPNHWDDTIGNKHLFFILKNAKIETPLRPFFNEFLRNELLTYRKAMEPLADKLLIQPSDQQMSGVGYPLSQARKFIVKVDNKPMAVVI